MLPLCPLSEKEDSRSYYTQRSFGPGDQRANELWVDMDDLQHGQVRMHGILSNTHKQAAVSQTQAHGPPTSVVKHLTVYMKR